MIKYQVLEALGQCDGRAVSGEELSRRLGVSRTAVWKAVESLRQEGYEIQSVRNRGYTLRTPWDVFNAYEIFRQLNPGSSWDLQVFDELVSTNDQARQLAGISPEKRVVVVSSSQTGGKGKRGTSFYSPKGTGVYLSILLPGQRTAQQAGETGRQIAQAACECLCRLTGLSCFIEDGNIFCQQKKLCGILAEASLELETYLVRDVVYGLGIHVNEAQFPPDLRDHATSLYLLKGERFSRSKVAALLLNDIENTVDLN